MASLLLKGGRVVDGTGKAAFEADVLVRDGKLFHNVVERNGSLSG